MQQHIVVGGDSLAKIAQTYLGGANRRNELFETNRDLIDDPQEIHLGWVIRIP